mmetsp:Transcript_94684/g.210496  ORF Transcript_94684/g.210496 Transcript_94684/m.210496 type:complete len:166 (+) Transcript_94684:22-519(+)
MYTARDYPVLNQLVSDHGADGLVVVGFPTAQFNNQEPGDGQEILDCLENVRPGGGFVPNFPLMAKTDVNGARAHAIWTWIKELCPLPTSFSYGALTWSPVSAHDIGWNFEKFLIDRNGWPCRRYDSATPAEAIRDDVVAALGGSCVRQPEGCSLATADTSSARRL